MAAQRIDAHTLKRWLHDGGEIALLDAREEVPFDARHLLMAACLPLSRVEMLVDDVVPPVPGTVELPGPVEPGVSVFCPPAPEATQGWEVPLLLLALPVPLFPAGPLPELSDEPDGLVDEIPRSSGDVFPGTAGVTAFTS